MLTTIWQRVLGGTTNFYSGINWTWIDQSNGSLLLFIQSSSDKAKLNYSSSFVIFQILRRVLKRLVSCRWLKFQYLGQKSFSSSASSDASEISRWCSQASSNLNSGISSFIHSCARLFVFFYIGPVSTVHVNISFTHQWPEHL